MAEQNKVQAAVERLKRAVEINHLIFAGECKDLCLLLADHALLQKKLTTALDALNRILEVIPSDDHQPSWALTIRAIAAVALAAKG